MHDPHSLFLAMEREIKNPMSALELCHKQGLARLLVNSTQLESFFVQLLLHVRRLKGRCTNDFSLFRKRHLIGGAFLLSVFTSLKNIKLKIIYEEKVSLRFPTISPRMHVWLIPVNCLSQKISNNVFFRL